MSQFFEGAHRIVFSFLRFQCSFLLTTQFLTQFVTLFTHLTSLFTVEELEVSVEAETVEISLVFNLGKTSRFHIQFNLDLTLHSKK